jgi:hypothetical protein
VPTGNVRQAVGDKSGVAAITRPIRTL